MALIKTQEQREVEMLEKVVAMIQHHERKERLHHIIMGGLAALAVGAFFLGHCTKKD